MNKINEMSFETKRKRNVTNVTVGSVVECKTIGKPFKGKIEVLYNNSAMVAQSRFDKTVVNFKDMSVGGNKVKVIKQVVEKINVSNRQKVKSRTKPPIAPQPVEQWDAEGKVLIKTYESAIEAGKDHGVHDTTIYSYIKGRSSASAFKWKWQKDKEFKQKKVSDAK